MGILNQVLLDILKKLKDFIEPPIQLPKKLNLQTKEWEDNPLYKGDEDKKIRKNLIAMGDFQAKWQISILEIESEVESVF